MEDYRDIGIKTYGDKCEICGHSSIEVHHVGYQEHQEIENRIRKAEREGKTVGIDKLLDEARQKGFLEYYKGQLSKDDRSTNLSVLCGNCHTLMHKMDVGLKLLKALSKRK